MLVQGCCGSKATLDLHSLSSERVNVKSHEAALVRGFRSDEANCSRSTLAMAITTDVFGFRSGKVTPCLFEQAGRKNARQSVIDLTTANSTHQARLGPRPRDETDHAHRNAHPSGPVDLEDPWLAPPCKDVRRH